MMRSTRHGPQKKNIRHQFFKALDLVISGGFRTCRRNTSGFHIMRPPRISSDSWLIFYHELFWLNDWITITFNCLSSQGFKCSTPWQVEDMVCFITMEVFTWMLTSLSSETWRRWFNVWKIMIWFPTLRKATQVLPPGQKVKWWNIKTIMDQFDRQGAGTSSSYG